MKILWVLLGLFVFTGCEQTPLNPFTSHSLTIENPYQATINGSDAITLMRSARHGTTVEIEVEAPTDSVFLYWLSLEDYTILSTDALLEHRLEQNLTITPVFASTRTQDTRFGAVILPDFRGYQEEDITLWLTKQGLDVDVFVRNHIVLEQSQGFIEYGFNRRPGDTVESNTFIVINVSQTLIDDDQFYRPDRTLAYDGPRLDWSLIQPPEAAFEWVNGELRGTGTAFHVGYRPGRLREGGGCIDGDTTVFDYPNVIRNLITNRTPSTRYFNFDTPETFPGGEEAFGYQATLYVCEWLGSATDIVLQTDPGDNLLDRHGRFLAWVWILVPGDDDYQLLNYRVVRQGLGDVRYLFGAGETQATVYQDKTYTDWMWHAQALATEEQRGLFGPLLDPYWDYDFDAPNRALWP